jgi:hypothetical protein
MIVALLLAAAQPEAANPFDAYVACNLDRARALIAAGEPDDVVRDRSYRDCYPLRGAAVRYIQAQSRPRLSSGALGIAAAGMDAAIERRVENLLNQRADASRAAPEERN